MRSPLRNGLVVLVAVVLLSGCGRDRLPNQESATSANRTEARAPVPVPTYTPTPAQVATPSDLRPTATTVPVAVDPEPTTEPVAGSVRVQANVRAGPGTDFVVVGSQQEGDTVRPVARTEDGLWLELATGRWIFATLVEGDHAGLPINRDVPVVEVGKSAAASAPQPGADPIPADNAGGSADGEQSATATTGLNSPPMLVTYQDGATMKVTIFADGTPKKVSTVANVENLSSVTISAVDPDSEDSEFSFAISGGDDAALVSLYRVAQSNSVIITLLDTPDFEAPHDSDQDNFYDFQLTVTSGTGARALTTATDVAYQVRDRDEIPGTPAFRKRESTVTDTTITVHWRHASIPGEFPWDYVLRYRAEDGDGDYIPGPDLQGSDTQATITGLEPGTEYRIELKAVADNGESDFSDTHIRVVTTDS